jgi:hypothetical protein
MPRRNAKATLKLHPFTQQMFSHGVIDKRCWRSIQDDVRERIWETEFQNRANICPLLRACKELLAL